MTMPPPKPVSEPKKPATSDPAAMTPENSRTVIFYPFVFSIRF
jgi:hypothetical protein